LREGEKEEERGRRKRREIAGRREQYKNKERDRRMRRELG